MCFKVLLILVIMYFDITFCEPPVPSPHYGVPYNNIGNGRQVNNFGERRNELGGYGDQDHSQPSSYEFGYQVKDDYSGNNYGRQEMSDGNQVRGEYRVQLPDGRIQIVTYYADWQTGYHADVKYEGQPRYPDQTNINGPPNQYGPPPTGVNQRGFGVAPGPQYGAPRPEYGAPRPQYDGPEPQYGAPGPQYGTPGPKYGAPGPQYGAPRPQYGTPGPQYGVPRDDVQPELPGGNQLDVRNFGRGYNYNGVGQNRDNGIGVNNGYNTINDGVNFDNYDNYNRNKPQSVYGAP